MHIFVTFFYSVSLSFLFFFLQIIYLLNDLIAILLFYFILSSYILFALFIFIFSLLLFLHMKSVPAAEVQTGERSQCRDATG